MIFPISVSGFNKVSLSNYVSNNKESIFYNLKKHGALLLTDFKDSSTPQDFSIFSSSLNLVPFDSNESAAPRTLIAPNVYTANEAPPEFPISFHHEMAQCLKSPDFIFFYCEIPAKIGGSTPIIKSEKVASYVINKYSDACSELCERGIRYSRVLPQTTDSTSAIGRSWKSTYGETKRMSEIYMEKRGIEWEWLPNNDLLTFSPCMPFFSTDHKKRKTFYNSAVTARKTWRDKRNDPSNAVVYGDTKESLSLEVECLLNDADEYMNKYAWRGTWKSSGDILLIDNRQVLHARESFVGPRKVLTSIWSKA